MNARHAARELALLTLLQLEKQDGVFSAEKQSLQEMMLASVRLLANEAKDKINASAHELASVSQAILQMEQESPENLSTPIGVEAKPVKIPTTREMMGQIEQCLLAAEHLMEALRVPEFAYLAKIDAVHAYSIRLVELVQSHTDQLDEWLNHHMEDWRTDRLFKMDRMILRLAAAEMKYLPDVDISVSINEAVELAKGFSSEESYRLINGVLGKLAEDLEASHV